jgi:SAM-dependent methyltransferase
MNEIANNDMNKYWNGDGGHKWLRFQTRTDASLKHFGHEVMTAAAISTGESVIDIGCGCGDTSFDISNRVGSDGHVQGIDVSEPLLTRAKARAQFTNENNITFCHNDVQTYHFESSVFDVVFSRFGVMFFDDPVAAFTNIRKTLKPGGRLAFICWQPAKENEWISLPLDVVKNHISIPAPPEPGQPGPFSFSNKNRVIHILGEADFKEILIEKFTSPLNVGADLDEAVKFLTHMGPTSEAMSQPGVKDINKFHIKTELRKRLKPYKTENGIILGAATWIVTAQNS